MSSAEPADNPSARLLAGEEADPFRMICTQVIPGASAVRADHCSWPNHPGRICLTNNAAERALRGIALGRKSWLFAGSDRGGERATVMYTLIQTRLNDVDPQAWLADVLTRINDHNIQKLDQLLPWNWKATAAKLAA